MTFKTTGMLYKQFTINLVHQIESLKTLTEHAVAVANFELTILARIIESSLSV